MGRPPMAPEDRRSAKVCIRMKAKEKRRLEAEAKKQGINVSDLIMRLWHKER